MREEGGKAMAGKCKWEMVINQMGSRGEGSNAAGRICCWVLRGRATEPGSLPGSEMGSSPGFGCKDSVSEALT